MDDRRSLAAGRVSLCTAHDRCWTLGGPLCRPGRPVAMTTPELQPVELTVVDTNTAEWTLFPIPQIGVELDALPLLADPDTGMQVFKMVYRAGFTNPWH